jgi:hypothetical protein
MPYGQNGEARGHSRSRSHDAEAIVVATSPPKARERPVKPPSQKAILSQALQNANTAVQLDSAQNFEGARRAYSEACDLLQQVLLRTTGEDEKGKLEAIVSGSSESYFTSLLSGF